MKGVPDISLQGNTINTTQYSMQYVQYCCTVVVLLYSILNIVQYSSTVQYRCIVQYYTCIRILYNICTVCMYYYLYLYYCTTVLC